MSEYATIGGWREPLPEGAASWEIFWWVQNRWSGIGGTYWAWPGHDEFVATGAERLREWVAERHLGDGRYRFVVKTLGNGDVLGEIETDAPPSPPREHRSLRRPWGTG